MKNTRKILALVLVLMMVFSMLPVMTASAADIPAGTVLYLVPSANWNESNARFAAYFFGSNGNTWVSMTKVTGESNLYQVTVPTGSWTNVIFCRMNPANSTNGWGNDQKWNQTSDLTYNGTSNCYTVKEGTWDKGGGTWSTYGSSCAHANVGEAATCTTAQVCLDCGDPVVDALGHTYNASHLCTRCNGQATFTVAGSGAHLGTEWDTGNVANDMTYADGTYTKVYTNVAAGSYLLKVVRDHDWGTAYPDQDKAYTVATAGSTVTITLKGTTVDVVVEAPHTCEFSEPTCTEPGKCSCGLTQGEALGHTWADADCDTPKTCSVCSATEGEALGHTFAEGTCSVCGAADPDYVAPETPHVNTLVVGDTNKIVVSGDYLNQYNLPIEWVPFVATEDGFYSFIGENGALAFIFNADGTVVVSATGAANLEAGTYLICVGNGAVGEFNVAVTKAAWVNALVVDGTSKIYVDGTIKNQYELPITYVAFSVTEKANYAFTCAEEGAMALIFDSENNYLGAAADLEVGDYLICVGGGVVGYFNVTVTKTAIDDGGDDPVDPPVENPTHDGEQEFVLGENTVIIDGCTTNLVSKAVEMVKFEVTEKAKYTFTSEKLSTYICVSNNPKDYPNAYLGGTLTNVGILEPGTYYICCGNNDIRGTFTVTVSMEKLEENCEHEWAPANCKDPSTCTKCGETEGEPNPEVHVTFFDTCTKCGKDVPSFVLGTNHVSYVKGVMLNDHYFKVYIPEGGTYVISGGAPAKVYMWSIPTHQLENGALTMDTPYCWNVDAMTESGFADSFTITVPEAGVYWIGINFDFVTEETFDFDITIELQEEVVEEPVQGNFLSTILALIMQLIELIKKIFGLV